MVVGASKATCLPSITAFMAARRGNLGLAVTHIAAKQSVHRAPGFHVFLNFGNGLKLVGGFLKGETVLQLALPRGVRGKGMPGRHPPFGVELQKIEGQLLNRFPHFSCDLAPFAAAQGIQLGRLVAAAQVTLQ